MRQDLILTSRRLSFKKRRKKSNENKEKRGDAGLDADLPT